MTNKNDLQNILKVQVVHGDKVLYDGEALSLSSRNEKGRFDVLPFHTNYISLRKDFVLINEIGNKQNQIVIKTGIMRVYENNIQIFLGFDS
jgi:F0F1-type ATP synthase epsilon subunit